MTDIVPFAPASDWHAELPRSIRRHALAGLLLMTVAFGGFGYWSFTAPLSAAVIAQGSFVATGRNKVVQHLEGGIIKNIYVREGETVQAGDPILSLDQTSAETNERELYLREMRLQATSERLMAEYREAEKLQFSSNLIDAARRDIQIASILDSQKLTFDITRKSLINDIKLLQSNIEALTIRERGYSGQLAALETRSEILAEDIEAKSSLLEDGLVRKTEVNALRRAGAEAAGQLARLAAEFGEVKQTILKHESEIERARSAYRQAALDELQPIAADLESVREQARQARSVLSRSIVRAPVSGTVVRSHYYSESGVIEPGKPIVEILPTDAPLIIEALVARSEVDSVKKDLAAQIRLTALNRRTTPVLHGEVFYISADALMEEIAGFPQEVYLSRISIPSSELDRVPAFTPTPGMPVEVMIQTAERTFASYLTKPITDSFSRAFRER